MYIPSSFATTNMTACHVLIQNHPLGTLFVADENGYAADHIPFILHRASNTDSSDRLLGHIARANPLARKGLTSLRCLTVFQGLNHYVSPNGYASKHEDGKVVPTWNYEAVHVHGTLTVLDDPAWLLGFLERLTNTHEATQPHPWQIQDAPEDYIETLLKAIVGIEITIERYEGKLKLSQNQSDLNRTSLVAYLNSAPDTESHQMAQKIANAPRG